MATVEVFGTGVKARVRAGHAAVAWINAMIAASSEVTRRQLYRTLSVEFFDTGVQFVGCDGHMLFRTWVPLSDAGDLDKPIPEFFEVPNDSVVVMDTDKFAVAFMRALDAACTKEMGHAELTFSVDPVSGEQPALGEEVSDYVLTVHALGQQISCKLYDGQYPNWRGLEYGVAPTELVEGMILGTRLFAAVGKLKGVSGIECEFTGENRAIKITGKGLIELRGLLMPMKREQEKKPAAAADSSQHDIEDDD